MKTTRIYWRSGLASLHKKALQIVKYRDTKGVYDAGLAEQRATPHFYAPVPQDRQLPIEEITCRAGQNLISPEDAVAPFGLKKDTEQETCQVGAY